MFLLKDKNYGDFGYSTCIISEPFEIKKLNEAIKSNYGKLEESDILYQEDNKFLVPTHVKGIISEFPLLETEYANAIEHAKGFIEGIATKPYDLKFSSLELYKETNTIYFTIVIKEFENSVIGTSITSRLTQAALDNLRDLFQELTEVENIHSEIAKWEHKFS